MSWCINLVMAHQSCHGVGIGLEVGGRRTAGGGRRTADGGRRAAGGDGGRRTAGRIFKASCPVPLSCLGGILWSWCMSLVMVHHSWHGASVWSWNGTRIRSIRRNRIRLMITSNRRETVIMVRSATTLSGASPAAGWAQNMNSLALFRSGLDTITHQIQRCS